VYSLPSPSTGEPAAANEGIADKTAAKTNTAKINVFLTFHPSIKIKNNDCEIDSNVSLLACQARANVAARRACARAVQNIEKLSQMVINRKTRSVSGFSLLLYTFIDKQKQHFGGGQKLQIEYINYCYSFILNLMLCGDIQYSIQKPNYDKKFTHYIFVFFV
jgi:hypothetical protein